MCLKRRCWRTPVKWANIVALLDPDPDSEYGSGTTYLIESGSNPDPRPYPGSAWIRIEFGSLDLDLDPH